MKLLSRFLIRAAIIFCAITMATVTAHARTLKNNTCCASCVQIVKFCQYEKLESEFYLVKLFIISISNDGTQHLESYLLTDSVGSAAGAIEIVNSKICQNQN